MGAADAIVFRIYVKRSRVTVRAEDAYTTQGSSSLRQSPPTTSPTVSVSPVIDASRRLVIGTGSGRSGTLSLAALLGAGDDVVALHEGQGRCRGVDVNRVDGVEPLADHLPWRHDRAALVHRFERLAAMPASVVCDVAFYYLPHVPWIAGQFPGQVTFLCLLRDRQATVDSFLADSAGRNHWTSHDGSLWRHDPVFDHCFPSFDGADKASAIARYVDHCHAEAARLAASVPGFRVFPVEALGDADGCRRILAHAGIDAEPRPRHLNRGRRRRRFHAVMTTCQRRDADYLGDTLRSLSDGGFFDYPGMHLDIFDSGSDDSSFLDVADGYGEAVSVHRSEQRLNQLQNTIRAWQAGAAADADYVVFLEDDIEVVPDIAERIERFVAEHAAGNRAWSFHAAYDEIEFAAERGEDHHLLPCPNFYGSLCLVLGRADAAAFARWLERFRQSRGRRDAADLELNHWLVEEAGVAHVCCAAPCLVQHVGRTSSLRRDGFIDNGSYWMNVRWLVRGHRPRLREAVEVVPSGDGYRLARPGHEALYVNDVAAYVLGACDGEVTATALAEQLARDFGQPLNRVRRHVQVAIERAHRHGLLDWRGP